MMNFIKVGSGICVNLDTVTYVYVTPEKLNVGTADGQHKSYPGIYDTINLSVFFQNAGFKMFRHVDHTKLHGFKMNYVKEIQPYQGEAKTYTGFTLLGEDKTCFVGLPIEIVKTLLGI